MRFKKLFIGILGITVLLLGVIMIVTPGPAVIIIPLGILILATEFAYFSRLVDTHEPKVRRALRKMPDGKLKGWLERMREKFLTDEKK